MHLINLNQVYDMIITDMKRLNDDLAGYTLLRKIIKLGNKTPLIIYTGCSTREQKAEAKSADAFDSTYDHPQESFELIFKTAPNEDNNLGHLRGCWLIPYPDTPSYSQGKKYLSHPASYTNGEHILHSRILILSLFLLLAAASHASTYGRSVEDLVGSFSIDKSIKIGSSSRCFSSAGAADPLTPPQRVATSDLADDLAPSLTGFAIQPQQISAASPHTINLTAHLIDDQGVWAAEATFYGPRGEKAAALFSAQNRISGTAKDGYYSAQMRLPLSNETNEWHLRNLTLVDREGNRKIMVDYDLTRLGLPTVITVI